MKNKKFVTVFLLALIQFVPISHSTKLPFAKLDEEKYESPKKITTSHRFADAGESNRENWRRMEFDLTQDEVLKLLGEPDRITAVEKSYILWEYSLFGEVLFADGLVYAWSEPLFLSRKQKTHSSTETENIEIEKTETDNARLNRLGQRFVEIVRDRVETFLETPISVPISGDVSVVVNFKLTEDGKLADIPTIVSPSGYPEFDEESRRAVIQAASSGFPIPIDPYIRNNPERLNEFRDINMRICPVACRT